MQDFVHRKNLELLTQKLGEAQTDAERAVIKQLLSDEERKEDRSSLDQEGKSKSGEVR